MVGHSLGRPEVEFDLAPLKAFYADRRVLITGAAGSIGSALSIELARLGCAHLAMLDQFDHGLISIVERVRRAAPALQISEALCDVRDVGRLQSWMRRIEPDVVFHAAALKHVDLGERHPVECVLTNLIGVRNTLAAAAEAGAGHFMLVSSDKAAAPSCVMGATKRLAELHLAGFPLETDAKIQLKSLRFGNVLGSQGSVLPRFKAQIEAGGPLEVTHQDMERYFMSDREAVGLILSVAAHDAPGSGVYFMEMGEPVSIMDLARETILGAGKDVQIEITGLRSGEKLKEQLYDEYERVEATSLPGVYRVSPASADAYVTVADVAHLESMARTMDNAVVRQRVFAHLDERLQREERAAG
jgi:FlaA1/EpsC-like NDP-sugar epimerase